MPLTMPPNPFTPRLAIALIVLFILVAGGVTLCVRRWKGLPQPLSEHRETS